MNQTARNGQRIIAQDQTGDVHFTFKESPSVDTMNQLLSNVIDPVPIWVCKRTMRKSLIKICQLANKIRNASNYSFKIPGQKL